MPAKQSLESKYRIDSSGCWIWTACISRKTGYGFVRDGRMRLAHRYMYERRFGPIQQGLHLDHLCRNRRCVNPAHLEPVSQRTNTRRGLAAKLTAPMAEAIRIDRALGKTYAELVHKFGISAGHVSDVLHGKYWPDAHGPLLTIDLRTTKEFIDQRVSTRKGDRL